MELPQHDIPVLPFQAKPLETAKDRVRLLPALNIPLPVLDKALAVLREELAAD